MARRRRARTWWAGSPRVLVAAVVACAAGLALVATSAGAGVRRTRAAGSTGTNGRPTAIRLPGAAGPGLNVIPFPGTPDASPRSEVIFSSLRPGALRGVRVVGSRSGWHRGAVSALPAGAGTAFKPNRPFLAGEHVWVKAKLGSPGAGTGLGDPGARRIAFSFTVAKPASAEAAPSARPAPSSTAGQAPPTQARAARAWYPLMHFHSAPGLQPPRMTVSSDPDTQSGQIFLALRPNKFTSGHHFHGGPMILNSQGQLVWFGQGHYANNLQVQSYRGRPVLTWLRRDTYVIYNRHYQRVAAVRAGNGYRTDMHDFQLTRRGTAYIAGTGAVQANLSSVGGPSSGTVEDDVIQEVDVQTGQVLWEWHAYGHIPLTASYNPPQSGFDDYFHLNSIQPLSDGNLLVSARNTWAIYKISRRTGRVLWTLGGKNSSFRMGPGTNFEWQHDARLSGRTLTLFDDADHPQEERQSSAKILRLDTHAHPMTARLVGRYVHRPRVLSPAQGSAQLLPNGNIFVGWGIKPVFSEYAPDGRQIFTGSFPLGINSYRALRFRWVGDPLTAPALDVVRSSRRQDTLYFSWNGATQVAFWRVLGGPRSRSLKQLRKVPKKSFETRVRLQGPPAYLAVQALDAKGHVLHTSKVRRG